MKLPEPPTVLTPFQQMMKDLDLARYPNFTDAHMQLAFDEGIKVGLTHAIEEQKKAKERNR